MIERKIPSRPLRDRPLAFPIFVVPHARESFVGYLMRLTAANYYPSIKAIAETYGCHIEPRKEYLATLRLLAEKMDADAGYFAGRFTRMTFKPERKPANFVFVPGGEVARAKNVDVQGRRFCAECLAEDGFFYRCWELRVFTACPRHNTMLCDRCPSCGAALTCFRPDPLTCGECGAALYEAKSRPATEPALKLSRLVAHKAGKWGLGLGINDCHRIAEVMSLGELLTTLELIYRYHPERTNEVNAFDRPEFAKLVVPAIEHWPTSFHDYLRQCHEARLLNEAVSESGLWNSLGRLYPTLYGVKQVVTVDSCLNETHNFIIQEEIRLGVTGCGGALGFDPLQANFLTKRDACARLSIGKREFDRLVASGHLRDQPLWHGKRITHRVPVSDVRAYEARQRAQREL